MLVALYGSFKRLPFGDSPTRPDEIFFAESGIGDRDVKLIPGIFPFRETAVWPMLLALHDMNLPFMAHVAAIYPSVARTDLWVMPEYVHVAVTTLPEAADGEGFPVVEHDGVSCLAPLWSNPWEKEDHRIPSETYVTLGRAEGVRRAVFWKGYFLSCLREANREAERRLRAAERALKPFGALANYSPS